MEIVKIAKSHIYYTDEKDKKKMGKLILNVVKDYPEVLRRIGSLSYEAPIATYDKLMKKLDPIMIKEKDCGSVDFREMPQYETEPSLMRKKEISIHYDLDKGYMRQRILDILDNPKTTSCQGTYTCWYPKRNEELYTISRMDCITEEKVVPQYPIYVISLGRYKQRKTSKYLDKCDIDYKIVVEPSEYEEYAKVIDPSKILVCPEDFSKRGQGGVPVRNFVWEHSISIGATKHWILDDNIECYYRKNKNQNTKTFTGMVFKLIEDYTNRYTNIKMSGHQYLSYAPETANFLPFIFNTRVFSSILLSNDIYPEFAWRGKYNEDVDLSIRLQKAGYVNCISNFISCDKDTCMSAKGGNTDSIYAVKEAFLIKAEALQEQHPDCVSVVPHHSRGHHHKVDYSNITNDLIMREGLVLENVVNNYGMIYKAREAVVPVVRPARVPRVPRVVIEMIPVPIPVPEVVIEMIPVPDAVISLPENERRVLVVPNLNRFDLFVRNKLFAPQSLADSEAFILITKQTNLDEAEDTFIDMVNEMLNDYKQKKAGH